MTKSEIHYLECNDENCEKIYCVGRRELEYKLDVMRREIKWKRKTKLKRDNLKLRQALHHIAVKDLACSPCNGRCDYDVSEHYREIAKKAVSDAPRADNGESK